MTEAGMIQAFRPFGNVKVEWPGKEMNPLQHKGYAYIIFENEKQVFTYFANGDRPWILILNFKCLNSRLK